MRGQCPSHIVFDELAPVAAWEGESRRQGGDKSHLPGFTDHQGAVLYDPHGSLRAVGLAGPGRGNGVGPDQEPFDVGPVETARVVPSAGGGRHHGGQHAQRVDMMLDRRYCPAHQGC